MERHDARVRAWQVPPSGRKRGLRPPKAKSSYVVVFDTETTTGLDQQLNFGVYEVGRWVDGNLKIFQHGVFVAEDLSMRERGGYETIRAFCEGIGCTLLSRSEFVRDVLIRYGHRGGAEIVGFNLKFDLARLAIHHGAARKSAKGGFSFALDTIQREGMEGIDAYLARITSKTLNSTSAFIRFVPGKDASRWLKRRGQGRFVELRSVAFGLSNEKHSLKSAAREWRTERQKTELEEHGVITRKTLEYAVNDVRVTRQLYVELRKEVRELPIDIDLCDIYSPASLGKAFLDAAGLVPPMAKFDLPNEAMHVCMEAFFGGRSEVRRRLDPVRVLYVDFMSMYPSINTLLDMWSILTAARLEWVESTEECQAILDEMQPADLFDQATWQKLRFFGRVTPDQGVYPIRTDFEGPAARIGQCEIQSEVPLHFSGPDLVASKILSGETPRLERAWKLRPIGTQEGLRPVQLSDGRVIDPAQKNLFTALIEMRKSLPKEHSDSPRISNFLKVVANGTGYGISAEFNREVDKKELEILGLDQLISAFPETPGRYCFPPVAALITAGARLLLGMLEAEVSHLGGSHVFCDTDSMAIAIGDEELSVEQVLGIVQKFEQLKPYDPDLVQDNFLELEDQNFGEDGELDPPEALAISAKRYALYRDGNVIKNSEHGLGLYKAPVLDPHRDWTKEFWVWARAIVRGEEAPMLDWVDVPLVSDYTASTPELLRVFEDAKIPLRPYGFILVGYVERAGGKSSVARVCAPFDPDPGSWLKLPWVDAHTGERVRVVQHRPAVYEGEVRLKTFRDLFRDYLRRPESSALQPDGSRCQEDTVGPLRRARVLVVGKVLIGKEGHQLERAQAGLATDPEDLCQTYGSDLAESLRRKITEDPEAAAAASGVTRDYLVRRVLTGKRRLSGSTRELLELWGQSRS